MDKIKEQRNQIDQIDARIMELLDQRFTHTKKIGELKKELKQSVLDTSREDIIFDKASKFSHYPQIISIYKCIMTESKNQQKKAK